MGDLDDFFSRKDKAKLNKGKKKTLPSADGVSGGSARDHCGKSCFRIQTHLRINICCVYMCVFVFENE